MGETPISPSNFERMLMKIFSCDDFTGHYPVGTSAIIIAEDEAQAKSLLDEKLLEQNLKLDGTESFKEINLHSAKAIILNNGDY